MSAKPISASCTGCFKQTLMLYYNSVTSILKPCELLHYDNFSDEFLLWQPTPSINIYRIVKIILLIHQSFDVKFCEFFLHKLQYSACFFPLSTPYCKQLQTNVFNIFQHKDNHWIPKRKTASIMLCCLPLYPKHLGNLDKILLYQLLLLPRPLDQKQELLKQKSQLISKHGENISKRPHYYDK